MERARSLAGMSLGDLAGELGENIPERRISAKGWAGQLLELALGASAKSLSEPDFPNLGIELKTLPINDAGRPAESTYVCVVPLRAGSAGMPFEESCVGRKLARVLWFPVLVTETGDLSHQRLGGPLLWSPDSEEYASIRRDWEELMEFVALGRVQEVSAHLGNCLQIRPKAANASAITDGIGADGQTIATLPRGFYLRPDFTATLLEKYFATRHA